MKTGHWQNQNTHLKPATAFLEQAGRKKDRAWKEATKLKEIADIEESLYRKKKHNGSSSPIKQKFENWVVAYMETRFGYSIDKTDGTLYRYSHWWKPIMRYLKENKIEYPHQLDRDVATAYMSWRQEEDVLWNTALGELRLLKKIMDEAVAREMIDKNPLLNHGLKRTQYDKEKVVWTPHQLETVERVTRDLGPYNLMYVMFQLGSKQACRSKQCQPRTDDVNFDNDTIFYDWRIMKGGKDFIQPIWRPIRPYLKKLVAYCKAHGKSRLCDWAENVSFAWSDLTKHLGFRTGDKEKDICFHGLRTTWATNAAKAKFPEAFAMDFLNHHSTEVHKIYLKFAPSDLNAELNLFADKLKM